MGPCDLNKYQTINLFVNDQFYIKMQPESFVIDIGKRGKCFVPFQFNDEEAFVLGQPFFRNFYTVFDDSKGIVGIAPSINFVHSSIVEGMVPNDELPHPGMDHKQQNRQNMKKIPSMSDPIGMITYYFNKVEDFVLGRKSSSAPPSGGGATSTLEVVGVVVVVLLLVACCCAAGIYGVIQYFTYAAPASVAGPQSLKKKVQSSMSSLKKKVNVKSSRPISNDGVSMANLLSAQDIEDRLHEIRVSPPSADSDEEQEVFGRSAHVGSSRNTMDY